MGARTLMVAWLAAGWIWAAEAGAGPAPPPLSPPAPALFLLELEQAPAVEAWAALQAARAEGDVGGQAQVQVQQQLAAIAWAQDRLVRALSALPQPVPVLYQLQRLFNGVAVQADPALLPTLAGLPGVRAVHPLPLLSLDLVSTAPLIRAPQAWSAHLTGRGVRIGIVDSGVDYLHRAFGGSGDYTGHVYDDQVVPWNAKVVGGWDFVGDDYNGTNTARPDGDPMDCNGHGTHVAGIAAGYGVTASGQTYGGPWGAGVDLEALAIGPGVAPEAQIYALKVFGCSGSTGFAPAALEWALDPNRDGDFSDRLDVVNLSLGSSFGAPGGIYATIADNAARAGMVIVASAGNAGDTHFISGSPATADRVISVANSVDAASFLSDVEVTGPPALAGRYAAAEAGFGPNLAREGPRTGPLVYPSANPRGCSPFTGAAAAALNGAIALIDRGDCTFATKVRNAQDVGARGVLVVNNVAGEPIVMGASEADAQGIVTPSMMISLADGQRLKAGLAGANASATLSAARRGLVRLLNPAAVDTLAASSSRGPRQGDLALKPDLSAPGTTVFAPEARSAWAGRSLSGTSMAAPHVAGAVALLRQLRPTWSVEELKALLMNTATPDLWVNPGQGGPRHGAARAGAGRLDVAAATATQVLAFADTPASPGRVGISFASPEVVVRHRAAQAVRVVNKSDAEVRLAVTYQPVLEQPGVTVAPSVRSLTVPAQAAAGLEVILTADAAAMVHRQGADLTPIQAGATRAWLAEATGHLVLTPATGPALRLPVYAAPRRRAALWARQASLSPPAGTGTLTLHLEGQDLAGGGHPEAAVTPLEWHYQGTGTAGQLLAGAITDFPQRPAGEALVAFGLASPQGWSTPLQAGVYVEIDTNGDGVAEWRLAPTDAARAQDPNATPVDVFLSRPCSPSTPSTCGGTWPLNGAAADQQDTAPFLTDVVVLYARVADLQLGAGGTLRYRVSAGGMTSPWLPYDLRRPGIATLSGASSQMGFLHTARRGTELRLAYDTARLAAVGARGVLLIHHHNLAGWRAQPVAVAEGACALLCSAEVPPLAPPGVPLRLHARVEAAGCPAPTVTWRLGDGSPPREGLTLTHTYAAAGTYRWQLSVAAGAASCQRTGVLSVVEDMPRPARRVLPPRP